MTANDDSNAHEGYSLDRKSSSFLQMMASITTRSQGSPNESGFHVGGMQSQSRSSDCSQKLSTVVEEVHEEEESKQGAVGKDGGILQMWWGLIQDQLGTVVREIDDLRAANSQLQSRLTEVLVQRSEARTELNREVTELLSQLGQEQKGLKDTMQIERSEHSVAIDQIIEAAAIESQRRKDIENEVSKLRVELHSSLNEKSATWQEFQQRQGEQLRHLLTALSNDIRSEMDNRVAADEQITTELASLRQACDKEVKDRISRDEGLSQAETKLSIALDNEHQARKSALLILQSKVDSLSSEMSAERDAWSQRRLDLEAQMLKHFGERQESAQRLVLEQITAEKTARDQQVGMMLSQFDMKKKDWHAETSQYVDRKVEMLQSTLDDARNQLHVLLEAGKRDTMSLGNLRGEVDATRAAMSKISSDIADLQQSTRSDVMDLQTRFESASSEIRVVSEACDRIKSAHTIQLQEYLANQEHCRAALLKLEATWSEASSAQLKLQESISEERLKREQLALDVHQRLHTDIAKISSERSIDFAELRDKMDFTCESCMNKSREMEQNLAANIEAMRHLIIEERASRENAQRRLECSLKEAAGSHRPADLRKVVGDVCAKDREQTMSLLSYCKKILASDEELRVKLKGVMGSEIITKELFTEEINRLWRRVGSESHSSTGVLQQPSSVVTSPGFDVGILNADRIRSARQEEQVARTETRGSSPLPPSRVLSSPLWQATSSGTNTPRAPRLVPTHRSTMQSPR